MADIHFHIWLYKRGPDGIIRSMERTGEQFDTRRKANYGPDSTACCTWTPNQVVLPHPGGPTTRYSAASVSVFFTEWHRLFSAPRWFFIPALRRK